MYVEFNLIFPLLFPSCVILDIRWHGRYYTVQVLLFHNCLIMFRGFLMFLSSLLCEDCKRCKIYVPLAVLPSLYVCTNDSNFDTFGLSCRFHFAKYCKST